MSIIFTQGPTSAFDSRGNEYVTLVDKMPNTGGAALEFPEELWRRHWEAIGLYLSSKKAKRVEWRLAPTISDDEGVLSIRSRLSVVESEPYVRN